MADEATDTVSSADTRALADDVLRGLTESGYYRSPAPMPFAQFRAVMATLGHVDRAKDFRTGGSMPIFEEETPMALHNDCNHYSDCVAWYCKSADGAGDRTFFTPISRVLEETPDAMIKALRSVNIFKPLNDAPPRFPVIRGSGAGLRLFWSATSVQMRRDPELIEATKGFKKIVNRFANECRLPKSETALQDGQFFVIDDHQFLHGRDALPAGCRRHLSNLYLRLHDPVLREAPIVLTPASRRERVVPNGR